MATTLQKTADPRLAYIQDKIKELKIRFPVAELTEKLGLSKASVSATLSGKRPVSDHFFETFCEVYKLDGNYNPFPADDPLNWERAKIIALERRLALALSKIYSLEGKIRSYEDCLDDIDNDTDMILADLRKGKP